MPRGRPKVTSRLCIRIDDTRLLTVDSYNLIIAETYHTNGKVVPKALGFYGRITALTPEVLEKHGVSHEDAVKFAERVKGIKSSYDTGKLILEFPEGFQSDDNPFGEEEASDSE